ncbi:MAG: hypothetical protein AB8H03_15320 [Saprospiraceae bacterium]
MDKIITILLLVLFFGCEKQKSDYPEIIVKHNLEEKYDLAKWELYKLNCVIEENGNKVDYLVPEFGAEDNHRHYRKESKRLKKEEGIDIWKDRSRVEEIYGKENVFDFITCELTFPRIDSSMIFKNGKIELSFFPECVEWENGFVKKYIRSYFTIIFEDDKIIECGHGRFFSPYPKSEQKRLEQKFIKIIENRKDKIHPWILEYYQNYKK